ncbi:MAG: carboxypeptidase M32 [Patescibacteria group bacterium]|jgi:carboxypeptidase Taq
MAKQNIGSLYRKFVAQLREIALLASANNIAEYDMEVFMPPAGADHRSDVMALIAGIVHTKRTSAALWRRGEKLLAAVENGLLSETEAIIVRRTMKDLERERKLPKRLVEELVKTTGAAHHVWIEAREKSDFSLFLPSLQRIVELKIEEAEAVGCGGSPYDALLGQYEPGMTAEMVEAVLSPLCDFLKVFVRRLGTGNAPKELKIRLTAKHQARISKDLAKLIGFDFRAGRLDASAHPFTSKMHPGDVRITTRYDESDLLSSIYSTIHETGHALYDHALPSDQFGNCAGEAASYGIHESQSRLWENLIGRSREFSRLLAAFMTGSGEDYELCLPDEDSFYRALNVVKPSLIRTESDEVTYNLHVALRFEIERGLIEGRIAAKDLPEIWNAKIREYLGVEVPSDSVGVLQDVHWSAGLFGYFPSYALGNLYSAQLLEAAVRELPDLWLRANGEQFTWLRLWLYDKVWRHGGLLMPVEIVTQATGAPPSADAFQRYLERKFIEIYQLK